MDKGTARPGNTSAGNRETTTSDTKVHVYRVLIKVESNSATPGWLRLLRVKVPDRVTRTVFNFFSRLKVPKVSFERFEFLFKIESTEGVVCVW